MTTTTTDTPDDEALRVLIDRQLIQQERAMPCVVEAVSANGTTVDVIVAISKETVIEGQRLPLGDRVIRGVPIKLYGSTTLGLFVCPPIRPGDDGEIIAMDRAMDNWQYGEGVRMPPEMETPRHGDFTDGMFYPGAQRASGAIQNFPTDALTMQTRAGTTVLSLKEGEIRATVGAVEIVVSADGVSINGNLSQTGNQIISGTVTANDFIET